MPLFRGKSPKAAKKTLKDLEEEFEGNANAGFDPGDPAGAGSRKDSAVSDSTVATTDDKPPWETEEGDMRRYHM